MWCPTCHTECYLFTWFTIGSFGMVNHRDHTIWLLWIQFTEHRSRNFDILEVNAVYLKFPFFSYSFQSISTFSNDRYTTFIVLYPIGVTGELLCLYWAHSYAAKNKIWSIELPNIYNFTFSYHYFLWIVMLLYIPLFPQLYLHMFTLRKKVLGKSKSNVSEPSQKVKSK